jgi:hypothetical protein
MRNFHLYVLITAAVLAVSCARDAGDRGTPTTSSPEAGATPPLAGGELKKNRSDADAGWQDLHISSGTQAHLDTVAIGAGNFWEAEYTGADGNKQTGQTAGLWLSFEDAPAENRTIRVGRGSKFSAGKYDFEVMEVANDAVRLRYKIR